VVDEWRYVDDPFEDDGPDLSTSGIENLWIIEKAQDICRRPSHPFHSPKEKRKWAKIDKQHTKGMIGKPWIEHCLGWAKYKNKKRTVIIMPALANYILNKARMTDWNATQKAEEEWEPTSEEGDLADDGF
jgi:hypothetical protein